MKDPRDSKNAKSPNKRIAKFAFKEDFPFLNFLREERKPAILKAKKTKKSNSDDLQPNGPNLGQRKTKSKDLSNRARLRHQQQKQAKAVFGQEDPLKLTRILESPAGVAMWVDFGSAKAPKKKKKQVIKQKSPERILQSETFTVDPKSQLSTITEEHEDRSKSGAFMRTIKKLMCTHESNITVIENTTLSESQSNLSDQKSRSQSLPNLVTPDLLQSLELDRTQSSEGEAFSNGMDDGIHGYLEEQRVLLEQKVGVAPLLKVYRLVAELEESENEQVDYTDLKRILGPHNECYIDDIIQLVVADTFFQ